MIPEDFFKEISARVKQTTAGRGKLYSRLWFFWLSECVDEMFDSDFIEKQVKLYPNIGEIREIYQVGIQLLQQHEFKIIEGKKKKQRKPISRQTKQVIASVLEYLNSKAGTSFDMKNQKNVEVIADRINEGYSITDFKKVIDKKVYDWRGNDMQTYLRPITLFQKSKFENYLNGLNGSAGVKQSSSVLHESFTKARTLIGICGESGRAEAGKAD